MVYRGTKMFGAIGSVSAAQTQQYAYTGLAL
jgi:hypothetical protein